MASDESKAILREWWNGRPLREAWGEILARDAAKTIPIMRMFGIGDLDGHYVPPKPQTDDDYTCHMCHTPVLMASLPEYRSLDSKEQGKARLCTMCWRKSLQPVKAASGNDSRKP